MANDGLTTVKYDVAELQVAEGLEDAHAEVAKLLVPWWGVSPFDVRLGPSNEETGERAGKRLGYEEMLVT